MHQNNVTQHVLELKQCYYTLGLYGTMRSIILLCKH
jgi:hypothetical protein